MKIEEIQTLLTEEEVSFSRMNWFYPKSDCRVATLLIDPLHKCIFLTVCVNRGDLNETSYDLLSSEGLYPYLDSDSVVEKLFNLLK